LARPREPRCNATGSAKRSATVLSRVDGLTASIEVFTTRIDTIYGATYLALAVEHPLLEFAARERSQENAVSTFVAAAVARSVEDRFATPRRSWGCSPTARDSPFQRRTDPIWAANFVPA